MSSNMVTIEQLMHAMQAQQESFAAQMSEAIRHMDTSAAQRMPKRRDPPVYLGKANEDLDLWLFATEEYYGSSADLQDSAFVSTVASNLGPTAMNWYRAFCKHCEAHQLPRTWELFKAEIRKSFRPRDFEYELCQRLCNLHQRGSYHDYVFDFQKLLIQRTEPITPLERRFYFQQGLRSDTVMFINEKSPATLEEAVDCGAQYENAHFTSTTTKEVDINWSKTATCHRCKEIGHIAPQCPHK